MAIVLPVIGQSAWGTPLNAALTDLDTDKVEKAGDTLTGSLNFANTLQMNFGASASTANFAVNRALSSDVVFSARVTGDGASRLFVTANGDLQWSAGTGSVDATLIRSAATTLSVALADLRIATVGKGFRVTTGANSKAGTVIAAGITPVAVPTTAATANSAVILSFKTGTQAATTTAWVSSLTAGTGFSIRSVAGDTATYNWIILDFV